VNKRNKIVCISLAVLVLLFIGFNYYRNNAQPRTLPIIREYKPMPDRDFVDNEVIITFEDNVTLEEKENFFDSLSNLSYSKELYDNTYVLELNRHFETRSEVIIYCDNLNKNIFIKYCEPNNIIKLDDCSKGPC